MVSFPRIAITAAIALAAAAPAAAQGSFSELQGIRTEVSPLNDLPAYEPPGSKLRLQKQADGDSGRNDIRMWRSRSGHLFTTGSSPNARAPAAANNGWYRTKPAVALKP
jgi:hypothetical protein